MLPTQKKDQRHHCRLLPPSEFNGVILKPLARSTLKSCTPNRLLYCCNGNKKLSCRRETAPICFVSLNILLSHSRSLKINANGTIRKLGAVSCSHSIVTMVLSCINYEIKRDIGRKSWFFHIPLHSTPPDGRTSCSSIVRAMYSIVR